MAAGVLAGVGKVSWTARGGMTAAPSATLRGCGSESEAASIHCSRFAAAGVPRASLVLRPPPHDGCRNPPPCALDAPLPVSLACGMSACLFCTGHDAPELSEAMTLWYLAGSEHDAKAREAGGFF